MPYLGEARNFMLDELRAKIAAISAHEGKPIEGVTWTGTSPILKSSAAHNLVDKDLIVLTALGGGTGLLTERVYYVKKISTTEVELFFVAALTNKVEWSANVTSASVTKIVELKVTRATCALGAAALGISKDTTTRTIAILGTNTFPCSFEYIGFWSTTTAESGTLYALAKVTKEPMSVAGSVEVKEAQIELDAVA